VVGGSVKKIFVTGSTVLALLAGLFIAAPTIAQAAINVPKSPWPICSSARTTYCVDAVTVTTSAGVPLTLTWVPTGSDLQGSESTTVTDTNTVAAKNIPVVAAGRAVSGRWTALNWSANDLDSLGYTGLYVEAKTANEFVNHVYVDVLPTTMDSAKNITLANQPGNPKYAASLDGDLTISVTVKTGEIKPGVLVGVGTNFTGNYTKSNNQSIITFTGSPVMVPLAAKSADCSGETGIAKANVRQLQAMLFINNDGQSAFGAEGTSGDMVVSSNGVCDLSTPIWNSEAKEFTWTAAAPHFAPDGTTENFGFYKAIIPAADAQLLWGLENPKDAVKALSVQVSTTEGGTSSAVAAIGVSGGKIIIDISGFKYSRPKLKIGLKKGWKPATSMANKITITCTLGKTVKKITATEPKCPKGYTKRK
jgi:hypothetical protein